MFLKKKIYDFFLQKHIPSNRLFFPVFLPPVPPAEPPASDSPQPKVPTRARKRHTVLDVRMPLGIAMCVPGALPRNYKTDAKTTWSK